MARRYTLFRRQVTEHRTLLGIGSSHRLKHNDVLLFQQVTRSQTFFSILLDNAELVTRIVGGGGGGVGISRDQREGLRLPGPSQARGGSLLYFPRYQRSLARDRPSIYVGFWLCPFRVRTNSALTTITSPSIRSPYMANNTWSDIRMSSDR